jgi:hypothetical protein
MTFNPEMSVEAGGEVIWGPDPADVAVAVYALSGVLPKLGEAEAGEAARAVLIALHEREGQDR